MSNGPASRLAVAAGAPFAVSYHDDEVAGQMMTRTMWMIKCMLLAYTSINYIYLT